MPRTAARRRRQRRRGPALAGAIVMMILLQTGVAVAGYSRSGEYLGLGGVVYPPT
jgi:hypothetical protein